MMTVYPPKTEKAPREADIPLLGGRGGGILVGFQEEDKEAMSHSLMNKPLSEIIRDHQATFDELVRELSNDLPRSRVVGTGPYRDVWLVRFLIGFDWKVPVVAEKFRNMLTFREKMKCDEIRAKYEDGSLKPSQIPGYDEHHAAYVCTFCLHTGEARDQSPINLERTCQFNFAKIAAIADDIGDQYITHNMEYHSFMLDKAFEKTGCLKGYVKIMDLTGASMGQVSWVSKWRTNSKHRKERLGQDVMECYPEMFSSVLVINSPMFFSMIWKLVQPVIPARTCEKVKVQSSSKKSLQMCLDAIDPSVLPKDFGGDYSGQWMMK